MNSRWYIGILIVGLTLLGGIANKQQVAIPNQEIVLQFTSDAITPYDTQNAISVVKHQLHTVGVENIRVEDHGDGYLKISYYSDSDVSSIKEILSTEAAIALDYISKEKNTDQPSEDNSLTYNLDVYEIQQADELSKLDGKLALETKSEQERFYNPNVFTPFELVHENQLNSILKITFKIQSSIAIAIDHISHKIPEVRAGPSLNGILNVS